MFIPEWALWGLAGLVIALFGYLEKSLNKERQEINILKLQIDDLRKELTSLKHK